MAEVRCALRAALLAGASLALLALVQPADAQEAFPADSAIRAILDETVETGRTAGVIVGLLEADGTRRVLAAGTGGPGTLPLDGESVFEIGSITKVFTGILLADMALRREVTLDQAVAELLPDEVYVPMRNGKHITLELLSTQHSGLPRLPANMRPEDRSDPYADYTVDQMYDFLSNHTLRRDPGESYEYSNYGVGLLGHALALEAGTGYEHLLRERVLDPLAMDHTAIELTPWMKEHLALGHGTYGDTVPNWHLPTLAGAGALRSTANDMLEFAAANLSDADGDLHLAMDEALRSRRSTGAGTDSIALGWHVFERGARKITAHNGGTGGYRSFLGLDVDAGQAVVILTNTGGEGLDDLALHLLDPDFPLRRPAIGPAVASAWRESGIEAATGVFRHAFEVEPGVWRLGVDELDGFGRWLLDREEPDDAIAILLTNAAAYPDDPVAHHGLGNAYREAGRMREARGSYARAVELAEASDHPRAVRFRASLRRAERELAGQ